MGVLLVHALIRDLKQTFIINPVKISRNVFVCVESKSHILLKWSYVSKHWAA